MSGSKARLPRTPIAAGTILLAAGLAAAFWLLPEWKTRPADDPGAAALVKGKLESLGGTLTHTRLSICSRPDPGRTWERAYRRLGEGGGAWLSETGGAGVSRVSGTLEIPGGGAGPLDVWLGPDGAPLRVSWLPGGSMVQFTAPDDATKKACEAFVVKIGDWVAGGRPAQDRDSTWAASNTTVTVRPLVPRPGEAPSALVTVVPAGVLYQVSRELSDSDAMRASSTTEQVTRNLWKAAPLVLVVLVTLVLFGVLLSRRRLSFRISLALGAAVTLSLFVGGLGGDATSGGAWTIVPVVLGYTAGVLFLVALFAVGESLLRDTVPGFSTSLDAFAAGQLGPRGGRSLLAGIGAGAASFGLSLIGISAAALSARDGVYPTAPSFPFPLWVGTKSPFWEATFGAGFFVLLVALFRFILPRRWAGTAAAILFALYLSNGMSLHPWGAALALSLALAAVFLFAFDRFGLASLLATALSAALFRDLAVSMHVFPDQLFAGGLSLLLLVVLVVFGLVGLRRPVQEDEARVEAPEYVRRLESERRVKYEMDLLSRMQLALLPEKPPEVPGLEIAVRTELATEAGGDLYHFLPDEAGRIWIGAGDVSGHGYSCGIQQAMVMAALGSLVRSDQTPSAVLGAVDRVLRMGRAERLFTSLVLVRLDPRTGEGLLANAGHPYPLLVHEGRSAELSAPGLPLGQGPARTYGDVRLTLAPGEILVLASDGLFEGPDRYDEPYGFERPRTVLEGVGLFRRPAEAIVEALFADWRRHVGDGPPSDDTTVLVVKRPPF
ncbi:MAG: PP2C family protein-serine/threonine phosphatase [Thermoanaerobaculia bacterium]